MRSRIYGVSISSKVDTKHDTYVHPYDGVDVRVKRDQKLTQMANAPSMYVCQCVPVCASVCESGSTSERVW